MSKNILLSQTVDNYGPNKFLPLAISYHWLFANTSPAVNSSTFLLDVLIEKKDIAPYLAQFDQVDIAAVSCYVWNWNYNCELAQAIKKKWPNAVVIFGGPQVPKDVELFKKYPFLDYAVYGENEEGFKQLLTNLVKGKKSAISGIASPSTPQPNYTARTVALDLIPSPILTGFYETIMKKYPTNTRWQVTFETMRGCPYHCAFCDIGDQYWNKTKLFSEARVLAEIDWLGQHQIEYVGVSDSNWGLFERDYAITKAVIETKKKYGFPEFWDVTWSKNNPEKNLRIALLDKEHGTNLFKGVTFALQSLHPSTLESVDRFNLTDQKVSTSIAQFREHQIPTYSELIWPMPEETLESFVAGLQKLVDIGQRDFLMVHPLVLTPNAPMSAVKYRHQHALATKEVKLDTFWLKTPENYIPETVEAVVGTNLVNVDETLEGHLIAHWLIVLYYYGWGHYILEYYNNRGQPHLESIRKLVNWLEKNPASLLAQEHNATKNRLAAAFAGDFWGRELAEFPQVFWEFKSATSVIFHQQRKQLQHELSAVFENSELVELNLDLCADYSKVYPFSKSYSSSLLRELFGLHTSSIVVDHSEISDARTEKEFYQIAYHYRRKRKFWACSIMPDA